MLAHTPTFQLYTFLYSGNCKHGVNCQCSHVATKYDVLPNKLETLKRIIHKKNKQIKKLESQMASSNPTHNPRWTGIKTH